MRRQEKMRGDKRIQKEMRGHKKRGVNGRGGGVWRIHTY